MYSTFDRVYWVHDKMWNHKECSFKKKVQPFVVLVARIKERVLIYAASFLFLQTFAALDLPFSNKGVKWSVCSVKIYLFLTAGIYCQGP